MIKDITIRVNPKTSTMPDKLVAEAAGLLGVDVSEINDFRIIKRSIDARQKKVMVNITLRVAMGEDEKVESIEKHRDYHSLPHDSGEIIIVGAGPAGLFAALKAIEKGLRPIVLERGKDVDSRRVDLARISKENHVDPDSNYCFGEGGAGAYSDGKLYTRSKKRGNVEEILQILCQHGASKEILIDAHPHIGSDKLPNVIKNIRNTILQAGGKVYFNTKVVDILIKDDTAVGVKTADGKVFNGPVILATGHSARDVYRMLDKAKVDLEAKGLAIGVRLEHPQHTIDCLQYHSSEGRGKYLPAAEYSFVTQVDGRGVYSFCMCPGGVVVPAISEDGQSVVNGMSASARGSQWANSGMVVELHPGDIPGYDDKGPLEMMYLQEALEKKFYEASGKSINAPAQRMVDFTEQRDTSTLPRSSYPAGIHPARIDKLLPERISKGLREGFKVFDRKNKGFLTNDAILLGLESRTSSPVRIPREKETLRHIRIRDLYPAGEGAGYAGGIVSAAIDGQRCVEAYVNQHKGNGDNN